LPAVLAVLLLLYQ